MKKFWAWFCGIDFSGYATSENMKRKIISMQLANLHKKWEEGNKKMLEKIATETTAPCDRLEK